MKNSVELEFGDGTYTFKLGLGQIDELQDKCGAGIGTIYKRVLQGDYRVEDCKETVRLGMIGGGVSAVEARRTVDRYTGLDTFTVQNLWNLALTILVACVQGYEPPEPAPSPGKKKEGETVSRNRKRAST